MLIIKKNEKIVNKINNKNFYYGIQILRMICSYLIVQLHCFNFALTKDKILLKLLYGAWIYVTIFFILSLFFSHRTLISKDFSKIKLRFQRLLTPYIIWPILFYFIRILLYFKDKTKFYKIKQLLGQLIIGFGIESVFWFQFNLIMAHLIFIIIIFLFKKNYLYYIQLIGILGFLFYPTKYHTKFFFKYNICIVRTIGCTCRILISTSIGFSIAEFNIINYLQKKKIKTLIFCFLALYLANELYYVEKRGLFIELIVCDVVAICTVFIFFLISFNCKFKDKIILAIQILTNYTCGIFCIHKKMRDILCYLNILNNRNVKIKECILIYLLSYIVSFVGIKILGKTKLKYLFI